MGRVLILLGTVAAAHAMNEIELISLSASASIGGFRAQCDEVIVSIYINPTQFSVNEDFGRYPRDLERDLDLVTKEGCAAVFTPHSLYYQVSHSSSDSSLVVGAAQSGDNSEEGHSTWVTVDGLTDGLCSDSRPTFFRGVTTVRMYCGIGWPFKRVICVNYYCDCMPSCPGCHKTVQHRPT